MRRFLFLLHLATGLAALGDVQTVVVDADTSELVYPTDLFSSNSASLIEAIPWGDVHATGTTAERPACGAPNFGFLYANTTTGTIQICSGIGWSDWFVVSGSSHNHDGRYLLLSGGTLSGSLQVGVTPPGGGVGEGFLKLSPGDGFSQGYIEFFNPVGSKVADIGTSPLVVTNAIQLRTMPDYYFEFNDVPYINGQPVWYAGNLNPSQYALTNHAHSADAITNGVFAPDRLGTGLAQTNSVLWASPGSTPSWAPLPAGLDDAPNDGKIYRRKNASWFTTNTLEGLQIDGGVFSNTVTFNDRALLGFMKFKGQSTNSTDEFWKIATIQPSSASQSATLFVRAIGGSVSAVNKYVIELLVANRNGNQFSYWLKGTRSIGSGIKVYEEADGSLSVYGWLTGTNNQFNGWGIDAWMGNWENPGGFTSQVYQNPQLVTAPTGTLVFDSTTSDPLVHMPNTGNPLVGTNVIWHAGNLDPNQFAGTNHTHTASQITSGVFDANRLGSGLAATNSVLIASPGAPPNWGKIGTSSLGALDYVDLRAGTNVVRMSVVQVGEVFTLQLIKQ